MTTLFIVFVFAAALAPSLVVELIGLVFKLIWFLIVEVFWPIIFIVIALIIIFLILI